VNEKTAAPDWINAPPIRRVTDFGELKRYVAELQERTEEMQRDFDQASIGENPSLEPRRHASSRSGILKKFEEMIQRNSVGPASFIYVYLYQGKPVSLFEVIMSERTDYAFLANIVSHPWYFGTLGTVVEFILNETRARGAKPIIELYALTGEAAKAYLGLGFVGSDDAADEGGEMELDLTNGSAYASFELIDNRWRKKVKERKPAQ